MADTGKIFPYKFLGPPRRLPTFVCDVELWANFKFMHGKFAHAVKINDAAAGKCLAQLVDGSDLLLAGACLLFALPFWPTLAIDNGQPAAGCCQILALALSVRLIKNARRLQINMMHGPAKKGRTPPYPAKKYHTPSCG